MTKRSKIKINARRKEQSAKRKVKSVQHRLSHALMEAQIASLEARIALLEEEERLQEETSGSRLQEEASGSKLQTSGRSLDTNPEVRSPKPEARAGITFPVPVLARVFAAGPHAIGVHWGGLFNRLRYFWNPVCELSGTVSRHRHWQPTPES